MNNGIIVYAKENEQEWNYEDCVSIINFIDDNLEQFKEEYNETVEDNLFLNANGIEYSSVIYLVKDENYGAYIDFDGENGYVVVTGNYKIYDMQVNGDLDFLRSELFIQDNLKRATVK